MQTPWFITLPFIHLMHFHHIEAYHEARFEKDTRYYVIRLSKDLLDDWIIILINGRVKSKLGQSRTLAFTHFNEAFEHFCLLAKVRHQRDYQLKTFTCDNHLLVHLLLYSKSTENSKKLSRARIGAHENPGKRQSTNGAITKSTPPFQVNQQQMSFSF